MIQAVNDRETTIQRQAGMKFGGQIAAAKIQRGEITSDEEIAEEVNKWMNKFQNGIKVGRIPEEGGSNSK